MKLFGVADVWMAVGAIPENPLPSTRALKLLNLMDVVWQSGFTFPSRRPMEWTGRESNPPHAQFK